MQTVWQARILSSTFITSIIICILIITLCIIVFIRINRKYAVLVRCICGIVVLVVFLFAVNGVVSTCNEWKYAQHNQFVIEGTIENFVSGENGAESFTINGTTFSYPISDSLIGYNIPQRDTGSVIIGEGQYVRLTCYSRSGVNVIIKIEACDNNNRQTENDMHL